MAAEIVSGSTYVRIMTSDLAAAVAAYTKSVDALLAADVDACSHRDLIAAFADHPYSHQTEHLIVESLVEGLKAENGTRSFQ